MVQCDRFGIRFLENLKFAQKSNCYSALPAPQIARCTVFGLPFDHIGSPGHAYACRGCTLQLLGLVPALRTPRGNVAYDEINEQLDVCLSAKKQYQYSDCGRNAVNSVPETGIVAYDGVSCVYSHGNESDDGVHTDAAPKGKDICGGGRLMTCNPRSYNNGHEYNNDHMMDLCQYDLMVLRRDHMGLTPDQMDHMRYNNHTVCQS